MKIWSAWLQGRESAPESVQKIFRLWEVLNPHWQLHVLDGREVDSILIEMGIHIANMTPQIKTDLVRLHLLAQHGGVWADATVMPIKPLDEWLTPDLRSEGFFAFRTTGMPDLLLASWFLYADKGNEIIIAWLDDLSNYFQTPRYAPGSKRIFLTSNIFDFFRHRLAERRKDYLYFVDRRRGRNCRAYPYMVICYSLFHILARNENLNRRWSRVPRVYHARPLVIGIYSRDDETPDTTFLEVATDLISVSPLHKLNHRDVRFSALIDRAQAVGLIPFVS